jgi:hypothetical protein
LPRNCGAVRPETLLALTLRRPRIIIPERALTCVLFVC